MNLIESSHIFSDKVPAENWRMELRWDRNLTSNVKWRPDIPFRQECELIVININEVQFLSFKMLSISLLLNNCFEWNTRNYKNYKFMCN